MNECSLFYNIIWSFQNYKWLLWYISYGKWFKLYWNIVKNYYIDLCRMKSFKKSTQYINCLLTEWDGWHLSTMVFMFCANCLPESSWNLTFNYVKYVNLGENLHLYLRWLVIQAEMNGYIFLFFHALFC